MFSRSRNSTKLVTILCDASGSQKSKMAAHQREYSYRHHLPSDFGLFYIRSTMQSEICNRGFGLSGNTSSGSWPIGDIAIGLLVYRGICYRGYGSSGILLSGFWLIGVLLSGEWSSGFWLSALCRISFWPPLIVSLPISPKTTRISGGFGENLINPSVGQIGISRVNPQLVNARKSDDMTIFHCMLINK